MRILPRSGFVQLCIQADAGTVYSLALASMRARLNAALGNMRIFFTAEDDEGNPLSVVIVQV